MGSFQPGPDSSRADWKSWKRSFEIYARAKGITSEQRLKDLLLHKGGHKLQSAYFVLPGAVSEAVADTEKPYTNCIKLLDALYAPRLNRQHEAYNFFRLRQNADERFDSFLHRLRAQAERCEAGTRTLDWMMVIQIITGIVANDTRKKLLEEERSLDEAIKICKNEESVAQNLKAYSNSKVDVSVEVQRVIHPATDDSGSRSTARVKCTNCGRFGHYAKQSMCPALGKTCDACGKLNHFKAVCKNSHKRNRSPASRNQKYEDKSSNSQQAKRVKMIENTKDRNFVFYMDANGKRLTFKIGGTEMKLLVDSGSDITIISGKTYDKLRADKMIAWDVEQVESIPCFGYEESPTPIQLLCTFKTKLEYKNRWIDEKFYVAPKGKDDLIGYKAAMALKILYIGDLEEMSVNRVEEALPFPKIPNYQIKLEIDDKVAPVRQAYRRVPFAMEEQVEKKIQSLLLMDIIEKVVEPPVWLSPTVPIPKGNSYTMLFLSK